MKRVAAIAIINDHHMLMGRRRDNHKITNPGGHLNEGEDPLKGAVREVKEETGLELDPHLFKHIETRVVKKPNGEKIEVHGYRVDLPQKPSTSMKQDPDGEVFRWHWIKLDTDLDHIKDNLHVPLGDNILLDNILKDKPMKKQVRRFWDSARKVGVEAYEGSKDKIFKEGPQQYVQRKKDNEKNAMEIDPGAGGALAGLVSGYSSGRSSAGTTANALSSKGYKTKNEETARNIARVVAPLGALGGLALGFKHKGKLIDFARKRISDDPNMRHLYEGGIPFLSGTAGGILGGAGTGALTSLRGKFSKTPNEKKASEYLQGGKADGMPDSAFPQDQLRMGRKIEREHTKDPAKANEVAKDHLTEDRLYYSHLKEMEDKYVEKKAFWEGFEKRAEGLALSPN